MFMLTVIFLHNIHIIFQLPSGFLGVQKVEDVNSCKSLVSFSSSNVGEAVYFRPVCFLFAVTTGIVQNANQWINNVNSLDET